MFAALKQKIQQRLVEPRQILDIIISKEKAPPAVDDDEVLVLRGLFYVQLYAAFEYSVNSAAALLIQSINSHSLPVSELVAPLYTVALHSNIQSLQMSNGSAWEKREKFVASIFSPDPVSIPPNVLENTLQNVWIKELELAYRLLGLSCSVSPSPELIPYIAEVVDKRNAVAHGRRSAADVGRGTRSNDLTLRLNAISALVIHMVDNFESHFACLGFKRT